MMMKNNHPKTAKAILAAPDPDKDGYDAVIAYCMRYSMEDLLKAGHATRVSEAECRELSASAAYELLKKNGLQLKLADPDCQALAELAARWDMTPEMIVLECLRQLLRSRSPKPRQKGKGKAVRTGRPA